jgi:hypothetical protein
MEITLPVSVGEAIDKYSILKIKEVQIDDENKLIEIRKEIDMIHPFIEQVLSKHEMYYKSLYNVNLTIWLDINKLKNDQGNHALSIKIAEDNDARFRIKNKLNTIVQSNLKEQKSWSQNRVFYIGHMGLGDMFIMNGAMRCLSTRYDEVKVVVKDIYLENVRQMYKDDPTITFYVVPGSCDNAFTNFSSAIHQMQSSGYQILTGGYYKNSTVCNQFYTQFYTDLNLTWEDKYIWDHFHRDIEREDFLYNKIISTVGEKYIFVHDNHKRNINVNTDLFIYNVDRNPYNGNLELSDKWKQICEGNELVLNYRKIMENAEEIYIIDSSFFAYAITLDLSRVKKLTSYRRNYDYSKYYRSDQDWIIHEYLE